MRERRFNAWFCTAMLALHFFGFIVAYLHKDNTTMLWCGFLGAWWFRFAETAWNRIREAE